MTVHQRRSTLIPVQLSFFNS